MRSCARSKSDEGEPGEKRGLREPGDEASPGRRQEQQESHGSGAPWCDLPGSRLRREEQELGATGGRALKATRDTQSLSERRAHLAVLGPGHGGARPGGQHAVPARPQR